MKPSFNKFLYLGFILLGTYQSLFSKDFMEAASSLGIGLAFDPFNLEQPWQKRPNWQKAILIVHLLCVALMFGLGLAD